MPSVHGKVTRMRKYGAIILAGGRGERFNGAKQDVEFHGKALWRYPFDLVSQFVKRESIVVVGKDCKGGKTRSKSVMQGLARLSEDTERVIILEAVRPMVTPEQIQVLLEDTHPSTTFVMPLVNTVVWRNGEYINRYDLYELLTPQAFDCRMLKDAYESGKFKDMTDETRVMFEYHGIKPFFIETGQNLFKVTYRRDIPVLESIYQMQRS